MKYDNKLHSENLAKFFEVASFAVKTLGGLHTEFEHVAVFGDAVVETRDEAVGNIGRLALDTEVLVVPFSHFEDELRSVGVETLVAVGKHLAFVGACGDAHGENRVKGHFGVFGAEVEHGLAHLFLAVEDGLLRLELREVVLLGLGGCVGADHGLDIGLGRYVDDIHGEDDFLFLCGGGFFFHDVYFLNGLTFYLFFTGANIGGFFVLTKFLTFHFCGGVHHVYPPPISTSVNIIPFFGLTKILTYKKTHAPSGA